MGWLRLVGSFKLQVFFAKVSLFNQDLLQKRLIILRRLLIVLTPWSFYMANLVVSCLLRILPDSPCASEKRNYSLFETVSIVLLLSFLDMIHHFTLSSDTVNLVESWRLSTSSRKWVMSLLCMSHDAPYLAGMIVIFDSIHHFTLSFDTVNLVVSWHLSTLSRKWVMSHLCMSHDTPYLAGILMINEDYITLASPCASDVHGSPWCYSVFIMLLIIILHSLLLT